MVKYMSTIEKILCDAYCAGAEAVYLNVGAQPRMRVNDELTVMNEAYLVPDDAIDFMLHHMNGSQRECYEEKGEATIALSLQRGGRCRVTVYKSRGSVALAVRMLREEIPTPKELSLPKEAVALSEKKRGLVLIAGGVCSGKTTTMASLVDVINTERAAHILTLESPIEYIHNHKKSLVSQREIGTDCESYPAALRTALREGADVIVIGELCGAESIELALSAAQTGALVLAEVNASGPLGALEQMVDAFAQGKQKRIRERLMEAMEAIVFQQLLPDKSGLGRRVEIKVISSQKTAARKGETGN